jgi:hypothetical protein
MYKLIEFPDQKQQAELDQLAEIIKDFEAALNNGVHLFFKKDGIGILQHPRTKRLRFGLKDGNEFKSFFELSWQKRLAAKALIISALKDRESIL